MYINVYNYIILYIYNMLIFRYSCYWLGLIYHLFRSKKDFLVVVIYVFLLSLIRIS